MTGPLLYGSVDEALATLPASTTIDTPSGAMQLHLTDPEVVRHVTVEGGRIRVAPGVHPAPTVTVRTTTDIFLKVASKTHDPRGPVADGRLRVDGDTALAYAVVYFLIPNPDDARSAAIERAYQRAIDVAAGRPRLREIPVRQSATPDEVMDALRTGTPMLIKGGIRHWKAMSWTPDSLRDRFGDEKVVRRGELVSIRQIVAEMAAARDEPDSERRPYVEGCGVPAAMAAEIEAPYLPGFYDATNLWFGAKAATRLSATLHRDHAQTVQGQIYGKKRFIIFSPDEHPYLHRGAPMNGYMDGGLDPEKPDLERFPEYANATPLACELEGGDAFILPLGWYHCTRTLTDSIAIGFVTSHVSWEKHLG